MWSLESKSRFRVSPECSHIECHAVLWGRRGNVTADFGLPSSKCSCCHLLTPWLPFCFFIGQRLPPPLPIASFSIYADQQTSALDACLSLSEEQVNNFWRGRGPFFVYSIWRNLQRFSKRRKHNLKWAGLLVVTKRGSRKDHGLLKKISY